MNQRLRQQTRAPILARADATLRGYAGRAVPLRDDRTATVGEIETVLRAAGIATFYGGGCVRDALLGVQPNDIDISVDAHISEARAVLVARYGAENVKIFNPRFGVCRFGLSPDNYLDLSMLMDPSSVEGFSYYRDVTFRLADGLEPDCRMRDFTFNALFWTPDTGIIDPIGRGIDDALARRLHICHDPRKSAVDPRLSFRVLRFASLGFEPDAEAIAFVESRIDSDTAWIGEDLPSWLHELTRGDRNAIEDLIRRAAAHAGDSRTVPRLRAAQDKAGEAFASYLEPTG